VRDFNKLPIPFLCIGSDIETGKQVILNKGNLAEACAVRHFLRYFLQLKLMGNFWSMVTNNYPIDAIRKLGADIIIGV
jgi:NTE family protein